MKHLHTFADVERGDVILCAWRMEDRDTGKPYIWRWFGVLLNNSLYSAKIYRLGAEPPRKPQIVARVGEDRDYWLLDPNEWPDGVHALRMKLILEGRIDI